MSAITSPDSAKAALIRQDASRFTRSDPKDRSYIMMTQPLAGLTFSAADRAEVVHIVGNVYQECLLQLQAADRLRQAANLPAPAEAAALYAYLLPRQAVQR